MDRLTQYINKLEIIEQSRAQKHFELNKKRQENKLSQSGYREQLKLIDTAHNELKEQTRKEYQLYRDTYRKALALSLNAPSEPSPEAEALWRKAIEKVTNAKTHEEINALVREASTWKDKDLSRALVYAHAGTRDKEYIHAALLGQDAVIDELYNFEKVHAGYRNPRETPPEFVHSDGFTSPENVVGADGVPGRLHSIDPKRRKKDEEERQRAEREQQDEARAY